MVFGLIKKMIGTRNDREIKRIQIIVESINGWEDKIKPLTDAELKEKTTEFKDRISKGGFIGSKIISEQLINGIKRIRVGIKPEGKIIAREILQSRI